MSSSSTDNIIASTANEASKLADAIAHETATTMISELANSSRTNSTTTTVGARTAPPAGSTTAEDAPNAIFSSIGLGIVNDFPLDSEDATEAACKAVQDSLLRGGLGLSLGQNLLLSVRVGVPAKSKHQPNQPMHVDITQLTPLVPSNVTLHRLEVVLGGLLSPVSATPESSQGGICSAVACLSFFQPGSQTVSKGEVRFPVKSPTGVGEETGTSVAPPKSQGAPMHGFTAPLTASGSSQHRTTQSTSQDPSSRPQQFLGQATLLPRAPQPPRTFHRANSMEVLARISAEIRDQQPDGGMDDGTKFGSAHSYKKLPPGKTPKNNKRLFVQHQYHDFSHATPSAGEKYLVRPGAPARTPNAAFPLKLHETLKIIEDDGLDHVIGWMPHGRSFKIHKHQEFVEEVLPKYFVMTKKSSFLRQLNLYGFNRLSGSGPDQGSYYHEKFLRGMKFLCRRMARIKVNGNGIRAAGNPDDEPNFALYPRCPLNQLAMVSTGLPVSDQEEGDGQQHSDTGHHSLPSLNSEAHPENGLPKFPTESPPTARHPYKQPPAQQHSFPLRLQRMLDKLEADGNGDVVSWLPHGRAFVVHDPERFVAELMPVYFNQTKYSSFQRQLHMYNFSRITTGRDKGAYWNIHFQRGKPSLTVHMPRTRVNGKGTRRPAVPEMEPDLWKEPPLPPIRPGTTVLVPSMPGTHSAARQFATHEDSDSDAEDVSDQEDV